MITWEVPIRCRATRSATMPSPGTRLNKTWGDPDSLQLSTGVDVRYITQRITEQFDFTSGPLEDRDFETNLPLAHMVDPGAYTELTVHWLSYCPPRLAARVDWVNTSAREGELDDKPVCPVPTWILTWIVSIKMTSCRHATWPTSWSCLRTGRSGSHWDTPNVRRPCSNATLPPNGQAMSCRPFGAPRSVDRGAPARQAVDRRPAAGRRRALTVGGRSAPLLSGGDRTERSARPGRAPRPRPILRTRMTCSVNGSGSRHVAETVRGRRR